jgi:hypothetical protein
VSDSDRERRARWFVAALNEQGRLRFPAEAGVPGWTVEQFEQARADLRQTLADVNEIVPLLVDEEPDGTVVVRPAASLN